MRKIIVSIFLLSCAMACQNSSTDQKEDRDAIRLVTLDPGHFHAALVQKSMYEGVDSLVHVYAPEGADIQLHINRIKGFNSREDDPTRWNEIIYTGSDFWDKFLAEKSGNVVVLSGNNKKKTEYIAKSLDADYNVLADKPMVINAGDFELLKSAFETAKQKDLLLYDIMTERFEITTILQREFSMLPEVFGTLEKGTPENPAVTKESVHHFYKYVSGSVLTRPAWFMDVTQQGEGIVDVTTHLVDLVQWECFPDQVLAPEDVAISSAKRWTTDMSLDQFKAITKLEAFPDYLGKDVVDDTLRVYSNGEINYAVKGVNAKVSVIWAYQAPEGTGDTHYSIMRGTKANLVIRQGAGQNYKPALYIEPINPGGDYESVLTSQLASITAKYPGVELNKTDKGWEVIIPEHYKEGHEAHFGRVMEKFLEYLKNKNMPAWEVPNMITKYYTTTKAREVAME